MPGGNVGVAATTAVRSHARRMTEQESLHTTKARVYTYVNPSCYVPTTRRSVTARVCAHLEFANSRPRVCSPRVCRRSKFENHVNPTAAPSLQTRAPRVCAAIKCDLATFHCERAPFPVITAVLTALLTVSALVFTLTRRTKDQHRNACTCFIQ